MTTDASHTINKKRTRWFLLFMLLLFLVPLLAAELLYYYGNVKGAATNHGSLLKPPEPMSTLAFTKVSGAPYQQQQLRGKWLLMYVSTSQCDELCMRNLYNMRQIRKAAGKNANRIERILVTFANQPTNTEVDQALKSRYRGTIHLVTSKFEFAQLLGSVAAKYLLLAKGSLYIVDPLGNILMRYPPNVNPNGVYKDMTRLLKVSQIG